MSLTFTTPLEADRYPLMSPEALAFVGDLVRRFSPRRDVLLAERVKVQKQLDAGALLDFLPETEGIRQGDWRVAPVPPALTDRRVEITGPAEPKMIINALNSGAKVFMADLEDSLSPTRERIFEAQQALYDAVRGTLTYTSPEGKAYRLNETRATLVVRPRGWHLPEKHVLCDGRPISGALWDFGMFFFHNAAYMAEHGTGPFFYIPKLENHLEARLWAEIFAYSEAALGIPHGTIRATILLEVITAAFEMDEILYELRDYAAGLNCGRWDYIFSFIKKFHKRKDFLLPDRAQVTMTTRFLKAYSELLIQTCHKRGAYAMGGMAPQIPVKNNEEANALALSRVKADKEREVSWGHDGTWVAHPGLIPTAMEAYAALAPNQLHVGREDVRVTAQDLLAIPEGTITEGGVRNNINVCIRYTGAWLVGNGCVPIFNLMEDAATAEISRTQLWQWLHHGGVLEDGRVITQDLINRFIAEELASIIASVPTEEAQMREAAKLVQDLTLASDYTDFITLPAYERLA